MNSKNIKIILAIVVLLLGFTGALLGVAKIIQKRSAVALQQDSSTFTGTKTAAYYFHKTGRCATCTKIGSTADETIKKDFAQQITDGKLEWKFVDYEAPENQHFAKRFNLSGPTLVVMDIKDGELKDWEKLDKMWELKDTAVLKKYFHNEVQEVLANGETTESQSSP